jgi:uncharacterized protein (TIGR02996 family)
MDTRDALIAAILANPDEDTPRLMYADWLDEHGDAPRAEFIRVQCALAREFEAEADLPDNFGTSFAHDNNVWGMRWRPHDTAERLALLRREAELLTAHALEWQKGLPRYADRWQTVKLRRGFVGKVCVPLGLFIKSPAELWRHHPVDSLALFNYDGVARLKIPKCRPLAAVRELLPAGGNITADIIAPIADCPHLSGLRSLNFHGLRVADAAVQELARSPHLKPVTLELSCDGMGESEFAALMNGPFAARLRRLKVRATGTRGAHVVADAPLTELRRLELQRSNYGDAGVAALTQSKYLTQLVTLDLSNTGITNGALRALAEWPGLASVRALNLGENREITARGLVTLLKSPHLRPIHIGLRGTTVGDEGAKATAAWPGLANLIDLDLTGSGLSDAGLIALADSPHWRDIRYLKVSGNGAIGPAGRRLRERLGANKTDIWG